MALARIISNSDLCSRELAINLLERGYAVEIVSPDAIPDNLADLEVRVETGPADLLSASVEVRGGSHSSTLQFIHQLKTPSLDMKRPAPVVEGAILDVSIPALAISANPLAAVDQFEPTPDVRIPATAIPANPLPAVELFEPTSEVTAPALAIAANPLTTVAAHGAIPVSTSALAHVMAPVVVDEPEDVVGSANTASSSPSADPPKKPAAFSEVKSLILLPTPAQEEKRQVEELTKAETPISAGPVFRFVIPKPNFRSIRIPRFDSGKWEAFFRRSLDRVRSAGNAIPKPDFQSIRIPRFDFKKWEGLFRRSMDRVRRATARVPKWFGWTALGLVSVMTLGLALEAGSRHTNRNPSLSSSVRPAENGAAVKDLSSVPNVDQAQSTASAKSSTISQPSQAKPSAGQAASPVSANNPIDPTTSTNLSPSARAKTKAVRKTKVVHHTNDDVAPNTITYFNRPGAKPIPVDPVGPLTRFP
jgi:hypothetical protein